MPKGKGYGTGTYRSNKTIMAKNSGSGGIKNEPGRAGPGMRSGGTNTGWTDKHGRGRKLTSDPFPANVDKY